MRHTLLLADGSPTIQRVVELIFADEDVQVTGVSDGAQAIARLESQPPDIVLADIGVGRHNGYELAAFVKQHGTLANIPVLLLAGAFDVVDEARVRDVGAAGVVTKPFEPRQLVERVRQLLDGGALPDSGQVTSEIPRPIERLTSARPATAAPAVEPAKGAQAGAIEPPAAPAPKPVLPPPPAPAVSTASRPLRLVPPTPPSRPGDGKGGVSGQALEDYFDQLDAAFAARAAGGNAADRDGSDRRDDALVDAAELRPRDDTWADADQAWLDTGFGEPPAVPAAPGVAEPGRGSVPAGTRSAPVSGYTDVRSIADAFSALLAVEQGEAEARPVRIASPAEALSGDEALVERVVARLMERVGPLIRDEVERLRKTSS